jgi:hypothetical protein
MAKTAPAGAALTRYGSRLLTISPLTRLGVRL